MRRISNERLKMKQSRGLATRYRILIIAGIISFMAVMGRFANRSYAQSESLSSNRKPSLENLQSELLPRSETNDANNSLSSPTNAPEPKKMVFFHHYLVGKPGAVIHDMLMCHAYAFQQNALYGGACRGEVTPEIQRRSSVNLQLLDSIGLRDQLRFACIRDFYNDTSRTPRRTIPKDVYSKEGTRLWTPEYLDYLKLHVNYPPKVPDKFTIAVHIRRQEVTPCLKPHEGYDLYLPNSHYQALIDKYMQPDARVVIFSQNKSFESFDDFRTKGYELKLDDAVTEVWKTIAVSDVVILSRSSFSLIPAVVAKGTVVYTPFWHAPLKRWQVVDQELLDRSHSETERLKTRCPIKTTVAGKKAGRKKKRSEDPSRY